MATFSLKVLASDKVFFDGECVSLTIPLHDGEQGILAHHEDTVMVIEAGEKSGTSITVNRALEQGRDVFAVPGRINDVLCKGTNGMIREGCAKPVFDVDDILSEYGITCKSKENKVKTISEEELSVEELIILKILRVCERSFDEMAVMTKFEPLKLNSVLTDLEFSGIIKQLPGRIYEIMPEIDI